MDYVCTEQSKCVCVCVSIIRSVKFIANKYLDFIWDFLLHFSLNLLIWQFPSTN